MSQDKTSAKASNGDKAPRAPASPARPLSLSRAADRAKVPEESFSHPFNPNSQIFGRMLSDGTGLERMGVHFIRIPAGKESFVYHRHRTEEEFIYVLSGRGIAEIDGEDYEVGPGDFFMNSRIFSCGVRSLVGHSAGKVSALLAALATWKSL